MKVRVCRASSWGHRHARGATRSLHACLPSCSPHRGRDGDRRASRTLQVLVNSSTVQVGDLLTLAPKSDQLAASVGTYTST
jgi:hypothetical protein